MRASFGIALGISAIDALLCAFTAVTVLALVVVSPTVAPGGSLASDITVLEVTKISRTGGLSSKLLVDIQGGANAQGIVPIASEPKLVVRYDTSNEHLFTSSAGRIEWSDSTCGDTRCVSHLTVTAPQKQWTVRLRYAGDASAEIGSESIDIVVGKLRQPESTCKGTLTVGGQLVFAVDFAPDGNVRCLS
jgi:hypothetical protein